MAIRQNISRADLAKWDASARAWLRRADQSMLSHHVQFKLVMRNVKTPFLEPGTTFEKVTSGWIQSMKVVEDSETYHRRFPIEQFWSQSEHGIYIQTCWYARTRQPRFRSKTRCCLRLLFLLLVWNLEIPAMTTCVSGHWLYHT
ncbi:hypothetical protein FOZG_18176 [Fusarium oxysporum Fo47]|uniref:Uncharacterized protein n=1 Tax=Fusarium oxysporum Fo47 TaxID=660027 RepID=W9JCB6_FUSOX|nr:hypothetical protein FOZG_18176 [Fusarium oxysporum Fo47]